MRNRKSETKVYTYLKTQIDQGIIGPNTKLTETKLAEELSVSRSPVRSALKKLAAEGYLSIEANKGAVVQFQPITQVAYLEQLAVFELLFIQYLFQVESKMLSWSFTELEAELAALTESISLKNKLNESQELAQKLILSSLILQQNSYYKKILSDITKIMFNVESFHQSLTNWEVLELFQQHFSQLLKYLKKREFPQSRRELRIFINELNLKVIDHGDLGNPGKYKPAIMD